ncbi:MAG: hypothetical protein K2Y21_12415 [Phycisphaerales bacterium]|nr:hypothetical protein [Phycisphaerales bacterium]
MIFKDADAAGLEPAMQRVAPSILDRGSEDIESNLGLVLERVEDRSSAQGVRGRLGDRFSDNLEQRMARRHPLQRRFLDEVLLVKTDLDDECGPEDCDDND